jgi:hypothetical protein
VKVKIWGIVVEHAGDKATGYRHRRHPGYRAQYAEIIEIVSDNIFDRWRIEKALKRYPKLVDGRK